MSKHAYLIIAHKYDYTFTTLLHMLDDARNDLFIHMDKKCASLDLEGIHSLVKHSPVYFTERTSVTWGGYSQINSELMLLKLATGKGHYDFYHLISGEDLPIQSQDYIHAFFADNSGKEFIRFESASFKYSDRVKYRYFFQEQIGRKKRISFYKVLNKCSLTLQKLFRLSRNNDVVFQKGTNWFSITDALARYVVSKEAWIKSVFKNTLCCDEVFLQTLVENSDFRQSLYDSSYSNDCRSIMRLIDWNRGNPYVFRKSDYNEIIKSEMLWARKFDSRIDKDIIRMVGEDYGPRRS